LEGQGNVAFQPPEKLSGLRYSSYRYNMNIGLKRKFALIDGRAGTGFIKRRRGPPNGNPYFVAV
jgi:hypothetical protein